MAIIPANRLANWQGNVGVVGGMPNRTTISATLSAGATAAQINSAISTAALAYNNTGTGQVVKLGAGNYNNLDQINGQSGVTLRGTVDGNGKPTTMLNSVGSIGINISGTGEFNPTIVRSWLGPFAQGSTILTLQGVTGLGIGDLVCIDQQNDSAYVGLGSEGATNTGQSLNRVQYEPKQITNIQGSAITVSPQVLMPNYANGFVPNVWRFAQSAGIIHDAGVEDLYLAAPSSSSTFGSFYSEYSKNCWLRNVESDNTGATHIKVFRSLNFEIRDSYFHHAQHYGVGGYGVLFWTVANGLVENNGFYHVTAPIIFQSGTTRSVAGYNFASVDYNGNPSTNENICFNTNHNAHPSFNLWEGNVGMNVYGDYIHGSSSDITVFRNWLIGQDQASVESMDLKTQYTWPVSLQKYNRYYNIVGNILGKVGYHHFYAQNSTQHYDAIYYLNDSAYGTSGTNLDSLVTSTLIRHGNYVAVTPTVPGGLDGNGPAGIEYDPNISDHNLPTSFYLLSKPTWFGNLVYPPVDPANPNVTATSIPAGYRYVNGHPPGGGGGVSVSVSPSSVILSSGQTQQFTATVTGSANQNVGWTTSTAGSITQGGLYTAPASNPTQATGTVIATAQADLSQTGQASVTILADTIVLGLSFDATQGTITAPFMVNADNTVSQTVQTTTASQGGRAAYTFKVTTAADYYIVAAVNCPDGSSNSFFFNIDGEPDTNANEWGEIVPTTGIQNRSMFWFPESTQHVFTLSAGNHQLIVRGREPNAKLSHFTVTQVSPPQPNAPVTPTPADGATNVLIGTSLSWLSPDAGVTFNVSFGTTNPPPQVASGLTTVSWNPPAQLLYNQKYYARVNANKAWSNAGESGTVTSDDLAWSFTTEQFVTPPPPALQITAISATPDHGLAPFTAAFTTTIIGGTDPHTYDWNFGDGTSHSTASAPSHTFIAAGTYPVVLTVTDSGSPPQVVHSTITVNVSAVPPPPPLTIGTITATPNQAGVGLPILFQAAVAGGSGARSYLWEFQDSTTATAIAVSHSFSTTGVKNVKFTVTDSTGSTSATVPVTISSSPPIVVLTSPVNGSIYTAPATVNLAAGAAGNAGNAISNVKFYQGATLLSTDTTAPYAFTWTPVSAGDYVLTAKATDSVNNTTTSTAISIHVMAAGTVQVPQIIYVTP